MRDIRTLDSNEAWTLVNGVIDLATADGGGPVVVSVYGADGVELAYRSMDDAPATLGAIGRAKANTAFRERKSTSSMRDVDPMNWAAPGMTTFGGGIPVIEPGSGRCVGALGVCGRTEAQDEAFAHAAVNSLWRRPSAKR